MGKNEKAKLRDTSKKVTHLCAETRKGNEPSEVSQFVQWEKRRSAQRWRNQPHTEVKARQATLSRIFLQGASLWEQKMGRKCGHLPLFRKQLLKADS